MTAEEKLKVVELYTRIMDMPEEWQNYLIGIMDGFKYSSVVGSGKKNAG